MNVASLHRVSKAFDGRMVLQNVTLSIAAGEAVGVIGPNGSGKTTLLRILLGLVHPDAGAVRIRGREPARGLASQRVAYFAGGSTLPDQVQVRQWARLFDVGGDPVRDERRFRALSRGQRQVIGLQVALARVPLHLVVLDEPWEGLDPDGAEWLSLALQRKRRDGAAVIVSSHRFADLANVGSRYAVLHHGTVVDVPAEDGVAAALVGEGLTAAYHRVTKGAP